MNFQEGQELQDLQKIKKKNASSIGKQRNKLKNIPQPGSDNLKSEIVKD